MNPEQQKRFDEFEVKMDKEIKWPPRSLMLVSIFAIVVGAGMMIQSLWVDHLQFPYTLQIIGGWACFFLSFYAHDRYDRLSKRALGRLRLIIDDQIEVMRGNLTTGDLLTLAVSMAERERLNPTGELN
jgi:hypothetical protein